MQNQSLHNNNNNKYNYCMICLGTIFIIANLLIGLAQLDDIVPMILVGRVMGGIGVGTYTYFYFMYIPGWYVHLLLLHVHSRLVCTHTFTSCKFKVGMSTYFYCMYIQGWYVHLLLLHVRLRLVCPHTFT